MTYFKTKLAELEKEKQEIMIKRFPSERDKILYSDISAELRMLYECMEEVKKAIEEEREFNKNINPLIRNKDEKAVAEATISNIEVCLGISGIKYEKQV